MSLDPEDIEALSEQLSTDAGLLHQVVHGGDTATVTTEGGDVPSLAHVLADMRAGLDGALTATSTSAVTPAAGEKTFAIAAGKFFYAGQIVLARSAADANKWMLGAITSYAGTALKIGVTDFAGVEANDWVINISGLRGAAGAPGTDGAPGEDGASAYEIAVADGFVGDEAAWLASLHGTNGAAGLPGGGIAIEYVFATTTTDADPGAGKLRLNNATQASATSIFADLTDNGGATVTALLDALDDSTNEVKGHLRLVKKSDASKWAVFALSATVSATGYRKLTVANVGVSGANPFANNDVLVMFFSRAGDVGAGSGLPAGGATGALLAKNSAADDDAGWLATTALGRSLLGAADAAAARSLISVVDYEFGEWIPTFAGSTTAGVHTYLNKVGSYIRMGKFVYVSFFAELSAKDAAMSGSYVYVKGFPFSPRGSPMRFGGAAAQWFAFSGTGYGAGILLANGSTNAFLTYQKAAAYGVGLAAPADITSTTYVGGSFVYEVT